MIYTIVIIWNPRLGYSDIDNCDTETLTIVILWYPQLWLYDIHNCSILDMSALDFISPQLVQNSPPETEHNFQQLWGFIIPVSHSIDTLCLYCYSIGHYWTLGEDSLTHTHACTHTHTRVGRDREIRPMKIQYETEKKWMLIFLTRRDRHETVWFFFVRDET